MTAKRPHTHNEPEPFFTREELLALEYYDGGEVRSTVILPNGKEERVGLNNLLAVRNRFAVDYVGNKFGAYFVVPQDFWDACEEEWWERQMSDPNKLPRTKQGGIMGVIPRCTIYVAPDTDNRVLCRTDHNGVCWQFRITNRHELLRKTDAYLLLGPNMGFDPEVVFSPLLGHYASIKSLEAWAAKGLLAAQHELPHVYAMIEAGDYSKLHPRDRELLLESGRSMRFLDAPMTEEP